MVEHGMAFRNGTVDDRHGNQDVIHQFMPEVMPEILPAALSMKIMPAFPLELHCVLA
jgi:hypothetical protein